jgi:hypothetical protein
VHTTGLDYGINANNALQIDSWISIREKGQMTRMRMAVTGCDTNVGRFVSINPDTNLTEGSQEIWIANGPSLMDGVADTICKQAIAKAERDGLLSKTAKPAKTNKSSI